MGPSGRKASRQGSLRVATVVMVKGRLASGFCSPTLTWARAATDARVKNNAVFANFIGVSPRLSSEQAPERSSLLLQTVLYTRHLIPIARLQASRRLAPRYCGLALCVLGGAVFSKADRTAAASASAPDLKSST